MLVKDVMTKKVITLKQEDPIKLVIKIFVENEISGAPVVEDKKVIGIVTEADIVRIIDVYMPRVHFPTESSFALILAAIKSTREFETIRDAIDKLNIKVFDFMNKPVITIDQNEKITKVAQLMNKYKINRLPVVKNDKLVGIIARADIIKALSK